MRVQEKKIAEVMQGDHPHWRGRLILYSDGTMERPGKDVGTYELRRQQDITLLWERWPSESLSWNPDTKIYSASDSGFRLTPVLNSGTQSWRSFSSSRGLIVGALSCALPNFQDRRIRCADTWQAALEAIGVEVLYLVGVSHMVDKPRIALSAEHGRLGKELWLPCPDDYASLPQKTAWFTRWALAERDFEFLLKCDDDTYLVPGRLMSIDILGRDYVGAQLKSDYSQLYASGGAGYFMSRRAAKEISHRLTEKRGYEDLIVGQHLADAGISLTPDERFIPFGNEGAFPTPDNDLISSHGYTRMFEVHDSTWQGAWDRYYHRSETRLSAHESGSIPKVFHRVWFGGEIPPQFERYWASWQKYHPNWEFKTWTEANLPKLRAAENFRRCRNHSERSDFIRHQIMATYGGVYLDTDFECFRSIEPLIGDLDAFAASEDGTTISTGILGSVAGHPFFNRVVESFAHEWSPKGNSVCSSGPGFVSGIADRYDLRGSIEVFPPSIFYPVHYSVYPQNWTGSAADYPDAFAIHHWAGSWVDGASSQKSPGKVLVKFSEVECPWREVEPTHIPVAFGTHNLGDDIQSEAACRLWNCRNLVDRDAPENWPKDGLIPLCGWFGLGNFPAKSQAIIIGYHCQVAHRKMLHEQKIRDWLTAMVRDQGFPAMCRDRVTRDLLRSLGIEAEFGGCVTLTFPRSTAPRRKGLKLVVDAPNRDGYCDLTHKIGFLPHLNPETRLSMAAARLELFSKASHVVTTRLHAYLPCVAMGTNVKFLSKQIPDQDRVVDYCQL